MIGALLLCAIVSVGIAAGYYENKIDKTSMGETRTKIVLKSVGIGLGLILVSFTILFALVW